MSTICRAIAFLLFAVLSSQVFGRPHPPRLFTPTKGSIEIIYMPDGAFAFVNTDYPNSGPVVICDETGQRVVLRPSLDMELSDSKITPTVNLCVLGKDGLLYGIELVPERKGQGKKIGVNRFRNVAFSRTTADSSEWTEPKIVWMGYTGEVLEYQQLPSGRLLVPFGSWVANRPCAPLFGCNEVTAVYSDDMGQTWKQIEEPIQSPCYSGYNGNNYGACEPVIEQLNDGSIWMLMRSQTGFLYESYSYDDGETWLKGQASRFSASHGPPALFRHENGWLVVVWNNCELPPRLNGVGVYGGRDALHIAVSDDEGKTWRGFREVYRDSHRNETPPKDGDRGTAYPLGSFTEDGKLAIISGQGAGRRKVSLIEPEWVIATSAFTDFSEGLDDWHVYKQFGPIEDWWQNRVAGCALVPNPTNPKLQSLHVRKPNDKAPDGAVWNFPNGWKGTLTTRLMLKKGFQGGVICLNDRMFDPIDENGQQFSIFSVEFTDTYKLGSISLKPDTWYDVTFTWDLSVKRCQISVNGKQVLLTLKNKTLNGISYVRFCSSAKTIDTAGFLVDRVNVTIEDAYAPACTNRSKQRHEETYRNEFIPFWDKHTDDKQSKPKEQKDNKSPVEVGGKVLG